MFSRGFKDIKTKTAIFDEFPGLENKFQNSRGFKEIKDSWEPCTKLIFGITYPKSGLTIALYRDSITSFLYVLYFSRRLQICKATESSHRSISEKPLHTLCRVYGRRHGHEHGIKGTSRDWAIYS